VLPAHLTPCAPLRLTSRLRLRLLVLTLVLLACPVHAQTTGESTKCPDTASYYETHGYNVGKVSIGLSYKLGAKLRKLLNVSGAQTFFDETLKSAQGDLETDGKGLKERGKFRNEDGYIALQDALATDLSKLRGGSRFTFSYITPVLINCDNDKKTLDVYYGVLSTEPFSYLTNVFEKRTDLITPSLVKGRLLSRDGGLGATPTFGYNRTRDLFGGGSLSVKSRNGLFDKLSVGATGSDSSVTAGTVLSGSHDFDSGPLGYAEWNLAYDYYDVPAAENRLKKATAIAQLFGATKAIGRDSLILRFGTSVEGGNRQASAITAPSDSIDNSGHGAIKTYVGASWVRGRQTWKASYGLQAGASNARLGADYFKHIGDFAYSARFLLADHKPLRFDLQLTSGAIVGRGRHIPVAERFFGGNVEEEFIRGDSWRIRANPVIRSFPQNELSRVDGFGPVGGKDFFSLNATLAQTVWSKPLMPREVLDDPDLLFKIRVQMFNMRAVLMDTYQESLPGFKDLHDHLLKLEAPLTTFQRKVSAIKTGHPSQSVMNVINDLESNLFDDKKTTVQLALEAVVNARKKPDVTLESVHQLIVDQPSDALLTLIVQKLPNLQVALTNEGHPDAELLGLSQTIEDEKKSLWTYYKQVTSFYDPATVKRTVGMLAALPAKLSDLSSVVDSIQDQARAELGALDPKSDDDSMKKKVQLAMLYVSKAAAAGLYLQETSDNIDDAQMSVQSSDKDEKRANDYITSAKNDLDALSVGFGPAIPPLLSGLADSLRELSREVATRGDEQTASRLAAEAGNFDTANSRVRHEVGGITISIAEKKAQPTLLYTERTMGALFRELNIVSVSPFAMFDMARIGSSFGNNFGGFRYGVGGGVRFSLATLDVSLGYSLNPSPKSFERRGAFFFSLDIYDLFR
jgi:hypothetical protein